MAKTEPNAKTKAAKAKASIKKPSIKKMDVSSKATSNNGSRPAANTKKLPNKSKNDIAPPKRQLPPIPKGWPVTSSSSYPSPTLSWHHPKGDKDMNSQESPDPSQKALNYLKPGNLLRVNCNGSDVFLRKRAVQSTSLSFPSGDGHDNKVNKGGPTRFLVVFPGRISLKPPKEVSKTSPRGEGEDCDQVMEEPKEEEGEEEEGDEPSSLHNGKVDDDDDDNRAPVKKTRSPFAPTNPPHLLGKLVSLGGSDRRMELKIPFPSSTQVAKTSSSESGASKDNPAHHLVFSGRAIPLDGKFIALTFKRTGGSGGGKDASKSAKNKKIGTGSIVCKDIFRSVIVLGESEMRNREDDVGSGSGIQDKVDDNSDDTGEVVLRHYGGSDRTVDGGGHGGVGASRRSVPGRKDLSAATSLISAKGIDEDESDLDTDNSDDAMNDDDENNASDLDSDGEFVPSSSKKKRNSSKGEKKDEPMEPVQKRTSRRSASKCVNVSYIDEDSDVDLENDGSESESASNNVGNSDGDEFDVFVDEISKKRRAESNPRSKMSLQHSNNGATTQTSRSNSKKGRKSSSGSAASAKKISYLEADSVNGDEHVNGVVVLDSDTSVEWNEALRKGNRNAAAPTNQKLKTTAKAAVTKKDSSMKATKSKLTTSSSPLKSPISPRRRKKASPHKTSSSNGKSIVLDLSDDSFSFL